MKRILGIAAVLVMMFTVQVQTASAQQTDAEKAAAYQDVIFKRAAKITASLNIPDSAKALKVTKVIAKQYSDLNDVYTSRDSKKKENSALTGDDKKAAADQLEKDVTAKVDKLHGKYLKSLKKAGLNPKQIDEVKNGMTYNVLNVTYDAYMDMMPSLTEEQKSQIMTWLIEAREHSMDAESSEKKHAVFGKYKGRVNNYLSQAGIDMKKEEAAWLARTKKAKEEKEANKNN